MNSIPSTALSFGAGVLAGAFLQPKNAGAIAACVGGVGLLTSARNCLREGITCRNVFLLVGNAAITTSGIALFFFTEQAETTLADRQHYYLSQGEECCALLSPKDLCELHQTEKDCDDLG